MNVNIPTISPGELYSRHGESLGSVLLDVRTPAEYRQVHARGARHVPLQEFDPDTVMRHLGDPALGKDRPVYLICKSGARALQAAERLVRSGYHNAVVVDGGTDAWVQSALPAVVTRAPLTLEQQVQISLGALVLVKVLFGFAVHPVFFVLVAALGVGLVWAGVTNSCALSRLLARLPWNRADAGAVTAQAKP